MESQPITMTAKACEVEWESNKNTAPPPQSPVARVENGTVDQVRLVPFAAAKLRSGEMEISNQVLCRWCDVIKKNEVFDQIVYTFLTLVTRLTGSRPYWESPKWTPNDNKYRTHSHTPRRKKAQLMTDDNTHKNAWGRGRLSKEKIQQCFEKDSLLLPRSQLCRTSGCRWYSHLVRLVRQWQQLSVIACATTLFLFLFLSINILRPAKLLPAHSIQKLYQCQNQMNLLWNVSSELSVSATPSFSSIHQ